MEVIHKIGRRKTSVARVYMSEGKGNITVNKKSYSDFFSTATLQYKILQPFNLTDTKDKFDLSVNVKGGGVNGQAEAVRLAISRALVEFNEEFKSTLKAEGLMKLERNSNSQKDNIWQIRKLKNYWMLVFTLDI